MDEAIKVINDRAKTDELNNQELKISKDIVVKNGRYGFYIKYKNKTNIPIPKKDKDAIGTKLDKKSITKERVEEIVQKFLNKKAGITEGKTSNLATTTQDSSATEVLQSATNGGTDGNADDATDSTTSTKTSTKTSTGRGRGGRGGKRW